MRDGIAGDAFAGSNYAELDVDQNSTISQTLNTTANTLYTLTFHYSDRMDVAAESNGLSFMAGSTAGTIPGGYNATGNNVWQTYTTTFESTGTQTLLSFSAGGVSDSYGSSLDSISVIAVPEPATLAMMAMGLGLLAVSRRARVPGRRSGG